MDLPTALLLCISKHLIFLYSLTVGKFFLLPVALASHALHLLPWPKVTFTSLEDEVEREGYRRERRTPGNQPRIFLVSFLSSKSGK